MPTFPAFRKKPYYDALKTWLTTSLNEDGTLKSSAVQSEVSAAIANNQTVVDAAAAAVDANPTIAYTNPGEAGTSGKALIQGPSSPKWGDMETVVFDHVFERSATPATNRANLQTLLDRVAPGGSGKQARLFIPPKFDGSGNPDPMVLDRDGANAWCVLVPDGVTVEGAGKGSTLKMADGVANFTRLLSVGSESVSGTSGVTIRNLRLDGNRAANNLTYEHNHCIFLYNAANVLIEDVETVDATGDGVSVTGSTAKSNGVVINRLRSTGHKRNPVTVEQVDDAWITHSYLMAAADSGGQAIDSEPFADVATGRLYIIGNVIGHLNSSAAYALTFSGKSATYPRTGVQIIGNEFRGGGINGNMIEDAVLQGNTGTISKVYSIGYSKGVTLAGNIWDCTDTTMAVDVQYSAAYGIPTGWTVANNTLTVAGGGMRFQGADNVRVSGGNITGPGTGSGVTLWATRAMTSASIQGVSLRSFNKGIDAFPYLTNTLGSLIIDGLGADTMTSYAVDLSTSAWITNLAIGTVVTSNVTTDPLRVHASTPYVMSGIRGRGAVWSCGGSPEGVITERIGAIAHRRNGAAGLTLYVKESGDNTNTGWVAK